MYISISMYPEFDQTYRSIINLQEIQNRTMGMLSGKKGWRQAVDYKMLKGFFFFLKNQSMVHVVLSG